jgi:hypothetical protein
MMLYYINFVFELFAFICCAYTYKKLDSNFKIFLPLLAFVVIYEFVNMYFLNLLLWHHTNAWCNNLESIIELAVYGYFIASLDKRKTYRKKVHIAVIACLIITFIDIFFIQGFWTLCTIGIVLKNALLAILVCSYYYNLLNNADDYPNLITFPPFLATMGLLMYTLGNFFYFAFFDYLVNKNNDLFSKLSGIFPIIGCIFLYSLLTLSFLCFLKRGELAR